MGRGRTGGAAGVVGAHSSMLIPLALRGREIPGGSPDATGAVSTTSLWVSTALCPEGASCLPAPFGM